MEAKTIIEETKLNPYYKAQSEGELYSVLSLSSDESRDQINCLVETKAYKSKNFNDSFQAPLQTRLNNQRDTILNVSLVGSPNLR